MAQPLKYNDLIKGQKIKCECPPADCKEMDDIIAFRWGITPI